MGGQRHAPAAFTPGKDPVSIVQEAGWASGPVWTGAENLAPPGFDPRTAQLVGSRFLIDSVLEIKKQHVSAYHWPSSGLILEVMLQECYTVIVKSQHQCAFAIIV